MGACAVARGSAGLTTAAFLAGSRHGRTVAPLDPQRQGDEFVDAGRRRNADRVPRGCGCRARLKA